MDEVRGDRPCLRLAAPAVAHSNAGAAMASRSKRHSSSSRPRILTTVVQNLLHGRYGQPLRVIALNVDEGWSQDVSEAMAHKVREIAEHEDYELSQGTLDFIDAHIERVRQPTLPLW
jgi:hypothetical protein